MRLFQNCRYYPSLRKRVHGLARHATTFDGKMQVFLRFRGNGCHVLQPVDDRAEWAFFATGDDEDVQRIWAREQGLSARSSLADILCAQIEHHRADVFYNMDVTGWSADFVRRVPGCVKRVIGWHALPSLHVPLAGYDVMVCNFPSVLALLKTQGCRTAEFFPGYDPEFDRIASCRERPVDVLFVGGYTRHHGGRAGVLDAVARMAGDHAISFHLDRSRLCRLAESPWGRLLPLARHRRPRPIRDITQAPIFGRDYYDALSSAKIVLNGSIDMPDNDRGNMRCFEAMGGGALLLTDEGRYPDGMTAGATMMTYTSPDDAVDQIRELVRAPERLAAIARAGHEMVSTRYSKEAQWQRFEALVAAI